MNDTTTNPISPSPEPQTGAGAELARMLTIVKRALLNWKPSAFIIALGLIAGVTFAVVRKPAYKSETIVIYRQGVKLQTEGGGGGTGMTLGTRLQEILMARSKLEAISDELGLYQETKAKRGPIEAVEEFRKDITFKPRSTDTFSISYKGQDPDTVKRVTERLAQSLIEENQRLRVQQSKVQQEFLADEKKRSEDSLKKKEHEIATFLSEHPEFALDQTGTFGATMRVQRQMDRESRMYAPGGGGADSTILALRRQSARLNAALSGEAVPAVAMDIPPDPVAESERQAAEAKLAGAKSDLANKQATFTDQHPDVMGAKARVAEAQTQLKAAEEKVAASRLSRAGGGVAVDPEVARQRLLDKKKKIEAEIAAREGKNKDGDKKEGDKKDPKDPKDPKADDAKAGGTAEGDAEALGIVGLETEWARRSRDVSEARDQVNELERGYFRAQIEAASSLGGYSDQVVVLDPAYQPTRPEPPGKTLIVLLAGGAAAVIAMILALMRALLDSRIYEHADLARVAPLLAVVPRGTRKRWWRR